MYNMTLLTIQSLRNALVVSLATPSYAYYALFKKY